jgi:excinuclease ABC subunit C
MFDANEFLLTVPESPGVYQMMDSRNKILYVGKARHLRRRLASYFRQQVNAKTRQLREKIHSIELTVTHTENDALLLESQLIRRLRPPFNVALKEGKGYPYLAISSQPYPRIFSYRGQRKSNTRYFGPYPDSRAVRDTLAFIQKLFLLRPCEDSVFNHRSRPCLQYQIKRCSAPCVQHISANDYQEKIDQAILLLNGKHDAVNQSLVDGMNIAAENLEYEKAAAFRDQIVLLKRLQEKQHIHGIKGDTDIIACAIHAGYACVQVFMVRGGIQLGSRAFYPNYTGDLLEPAVLSAFVSQYYLNKDIPKDILLSHPAEEQQWLEHSLSERASHPVHLLNTVKNAQKHGFQMAIHNARDAVVRYSARRLGQKNRFLALQTLLALDTLPTRLECFDISHTFGEATVASCVVFDRKGPLKSAYRRFNINNIKSGDDYAALLQALSRRYQKDPHEWPDILFIDGGKGQLKQAITVMETASSPPLIVSVAKGLARKSGEETLFIWKKTSTIQELAGLDPTSPAFHLIQHIRDESHRFAISGHRAQRAKKRNQSPLEGIAGVGPVLRQRLLTQFGGFQSLKRAGIEDLHAVQGVGVALAKTLYEALKKF